MASRRELILDTYEKALEAEGQRHSEALKKAKEICLEGLKAERQGKTPDLIRGDKEVKQ